MMLIDCDSCVVRGTACATCPVTVLLDPTRPEGDLTGAEQRAIEVFERGGFTVEVLTPPPPRPLRLNPRPARRPRRRVA
jgi:hypothetical protein